MNDAYFGNKKISISQRRYLGSKTKLLTFIDNIIEKEKIQFESFADIFAGTGTVASHFHNRTKIILNDILDSNSHIYYAYFGKDPIREDKLKEILNTYNNLDLNSYDDNYFSQNFANTYFDYENSKKIGAIRDHIESISKKNIITPREKSYLITSLLYALDKIANTVGHYDAYRKVTILKKKLILQPLAILKSPYPAEIYKEDANSLVKKISADIVYIDPPYNSRQYSDAYHLLENIATWKKQKVFGVAKKIDRSHIKSQYNLKTAGDAFEDLIRNINAKYILVSYNDMGNSGDLRSQSRISDHQILSALKLRGEVKIYETNFKQFTTGKSGKGDLKERIFFCRISAATKNNIRLVSSKNNPVTRGYVKSPLNYTGGKHKLLPQIMPLFPSNIHTFYDIFAGGANVGINADAHNIVCIEKNAYVVKLLKLIQNNNFVDLNQKIIETIEEFGLSHSYLKSYAHYNANSSLGLGQYNKPSYLRLRDCFNKHPDRTDWLLVLILYSFNNQIRFNQKGEFNLPVGKRDYNGSSRKNIASFNQLSNEKKISFLSRDFRSIEKMKISSNDFLYLDPPYLLGHASYNESGGWTESDEIDLYNLLTRLNQHGIRFALSNLIQHKGKVNEILKKWVEANLFITHKLESDYRNSSYHSNGKYKKTVEVLITNY